MAEIAATSNHARMKYTGFARWWVGFQGSELLPIIPPNAQLSPDSKVSLDNRGKTPGKFTSGGWVGLGGTWSTKLRAEKNDVKRWDHWGASVGLQTRIYIAIDIDVDDEQMSAAIEGEFKRVFGAAPVRYRDGSSRRLMLTCIADGELPLRKRRLKFLINGKAHVVERLATGQQCVVEGPHPKGGEYKWRDGHPCECLHKLPKHTKAKSDEFFAAVTSLIEMYGYEVVADKGNESNTAGKRKAIGSPELLAPSPERVLEVLAAVPCDDKVFESRDDFVQALSAIKAALGGSYWDEVLDWALNYPGAGDDYIATIWDSIRDAELGWSWLEAWARSHGYSSAEADFADTADDPKNVIPDGPLDRMVARFIWCGEVERYYDTETHKFITALALNAICTDVAAYGTSGTNTAAAQFQNHPKVRKADIVTFRPAQPLIIKEGSATALNTWRPSRYVPAKNVADADVRLWLDHIELIFGSLAEPAANHVLDWMAFVIQRPGEKINHALVIYGETQGTGKDSAFTPFFRKIGVPHNVSFITPERLRGQWTDHLETQVVCVEEMMNFNRGEMANKLKPLLAAPPHVVSINQKNVKQYDIPNIQNWIMFTNHADAISIEATDRRYWIHKCLLESPREPAYYTRLHRWYDAGGVEKVAGWLSQRDIASFNPNAAPPNTEAKRDMLEQSQPEAVRYIRRLLREGGPFGARTILIVQELLDAARGDFEAPHVNHKHAATALAAEAFKQTHRFKINGDARQVWSRDPQGVLRKLSNDQMRDRYLAEGPAGVLRIVA